MESGNLATMQKSLARRAIDIENFYCNHDHDQSHKQTSDYQSANASTTDSYHTFEEPILKKSNKNTSKNLFPLSVSSNNDSETICFRSNTEPTKYNQDTYFVFKRQENDTLKSNEYCLKGENRDSGFTNLQSPKKYEFAQDKKPPMERYYEHRSHSHSKKARSPQKTGNPGNTKWSANKRIKTLLDRSIRTKVKKPQHKNFSSERLGLILEELMEQNIKQRSRKLSELSALVWYLRRGLPVEDLPSEYLKILIKILCQNQNLNCIDLPSFPADQLESDSYSESSIELKNSETDYYDDATSVSESSSQERENVQSPVSNKFDTYFAKAYSQQQYNDENTTRLTIPKSDVGLQINFPNTEVLDYEAVPKCGINCTRNLRSIYKAEPRCRSCRCPLRQSSDFGEHAGNSSLFPSCRSNNLMLDLCTNLCRLTNELLNGHRELMSQLEHLSRTITSNISSQSSETSRGDVDPNIPKKVPRRIEDDNVSYRNLEVGNEEPKSVMIDAESCSFEDDIDLTNVPFSGFHNLSFESPRSREERAFSKSRLSCHPDFLTFSLNQSTPSPNPFNRLCSSLPENYFKWSEQFIKVKQEHLSKYQDQIDRLKKTNEMITRELLENNRKLSENNDNIPIKMVSPPIFQFPTVLEEGQEYSNEITPRNSNIEFMESQQDSVAYSSDFEEASEPTSNGLSDRNVLIIEGNAIKLQSSIGESPDRKKSSSSIEKISVNDSMSKSSTYCIGSIKSKIFETIYSTVVKLISQHETNPKLLIELFKRLHALGQDEKKWREIISILRYQQLRSMTEHSLEEVLKSKSDTNLEDRKESFESNLHESISVSTRMDESSQTSEYSRTPIKFLSESSGQTSYVDDEREFQARDILEHRSHSSASSSHSSGNDLASTMVKNSQQFSSLIQVHVREKNCLKNIKSPTKRFTLHNRNALHSSLNQPKTSEHFLNRKHNALHSSLHLRNLFNTPIFLEPVSDTSNSPMTPPNPRPSYATSVNNNPEDINSSEIINTSDLEEELRSNNDSQISLSESRSKTFSSFVICHIDCRIQLLLNNIITKLRSSYTRTPSLECNNSKHIERPFAITEELGTAWELCLAQISTSTIARIGPGLGRWICASIIRRVNQLICSWKPIRRHSSFKKRTNLNPKNDNNNNKDNFRFGWFERPEMKEEFNGYFITQLENQLLDTVKRYQGELIADCVELLMSALEDILTEELAFYSLMTEKDATMEYRSLSGSIRPPSGDSMQPSNVGRVRI